MTKKGSGLSFDRNLPLLHCFQQGALSLRGGSIYLVCQHQLTKDWPWVKQKFMGVLVENRNPQNICRLSYPYRAGPR
jgi:hypothetical protein